MYALLPMKKNSQRVPNKNITKINGKPLFFYIADTLKKTKLFEKLVINTDSDQIVNLSKKRYGNWIIIIKRPKNLVGDGVSMNRIINYDINKIGNNNDFFQTHSTNPFLKSSTIINAVKKFYTGKRKRSNFSLFSVNELKSRLYDNNLTAINHNPLKLKKTQNLHPTFEENSNFYIFSGNSFIENNNRIGKNCDVYVMNRNSIETIDIDDKPDLKLTKAILKYEN